MAEPVSLFLASAGITGIFTSCIQCFEYIQLGKSFGEDYERCLLRIDLVQLRLSRWWESLHAPGREPPSLRSEQHLQTMESTMEDILYQFDKARKLSVKYQSRAATADLAVCDPESDLEPSRWRLHSKLRGMAHRRQKDLPLAKKVAWVLYDQKKFDQLIEKVTDSVNSLVTLFPSEELQTVQQELCRGEVEELESEYGPDLEALHDSSCKVDGLLEETLREAARTRGGNRYEALTVTGSAMVENGDYVAQGAVVTGPGNVYSGIHISGETRVRNGTNYGGRGVFD